MSLTTSKLSAGGLIMLINIHSDQTKLLGLRVQLHMIARCFYQNHAERAAALDAVVLFLENEFQLNSPEQCNPNYYLMVALWNTLIVLKCSRLTHNQARAMTWFCVNLIDTLFREDMDAQKERGFQFNPGFKKVPEPTGFIPFWETPPDLDSSCGTD
jgi:hypothetical protein